MLIRWSRLAAMAMVLLPIGGLSYNAQADIPVQAAAQNLGAAWQGLGMLAEPGTAGLIFMGSLWFVVRCLGRRLRGEARKD